jgi:signal transduction histidine kinase
MRHESQQRKVILEVKRRFVRFVSHEIRTPLNTVCLGLELLQSELDTKRTKRSNTGNEGDGDETDTLLGHDEKLEHWQHLTDDILENANNAVGILNDLLNYDKIEQGTFKLEIGTVHIWELVRATVSAFNIQAEKRQMALELTSVDSRKKLFEI